MVAKQCTIEFMTKDEDFFPFIHHPILDSVRLIFSPILLNYLKECLDWCFLS